MSREVTRRSFYSVIINLMGAAMAAVIAVPAAAYLLLRPKSESQDDSIEIGDLSQLPVGKPREVTFFRTRSDGWKRIREKTSTWVVRDKDNSVAAFVPQCTHLGCAYHWEGEQNQFVCPCHNSVFAMDGSVVAGPAPRPLDRYLTQIDGGKLLIRSPQERV